MFLTYQYVDGIQGSDDVYLARCECGILCRVTCPKWDHADWRRSLAYLKSIYEYIFRTAVISKEQELYVPLLGMENNSVPVHRSVEAFWEAACASDFNGRCIFEIPKLSGRVVTDPEYSFLYDYKQIYFDRPKQDIFIRVIRDVMPGTDKLFIVEKGTEEDPPFDPAKDMDMSKGVFVSPERTWQASKDNDGLARNLFAVMHPMLYEPDIFLMNTAGSLPNGDEVVIFKLTADASVSGCLVPDGNYKNNDFIICRLPQGCGSVSFSMTDMSRTVHLTFFTKNSLKDSFEGCIIGGAAGDALGYPVEFMKYKSIIKEYGHEGIQEFVLEDGLAKITDDTQMTLYTMDGLRTGILRAEFKGISAPAEAYIAWAYADWLAGQDGLRGKWNRFTDLFEYEPGLDARRAPGITCLDALRKQNSASKNPPYTNEYYTIEHPGNESKGCGGVMRVAPVGLMLSSNHWIGKMSAAYIAGEAAAITHGHPLGFLPAAYLGELIHRITYRMDGDAPLSFIMERTLETINTLFPGTKYLDIFTGIVEKAFALADLANDSDKADDVINIHKIGEGWVGEEALAIALYCVRRYPDDFQAALRLSVNHNGDSDSTGAIAGNILGAYLGLNEIKRQTENTEKMPLRLEKLELYDHMLYWTDAAFSVIYDTKNNPDNSVVPKKKYDFGLGDLECPEALDRKGKTAYFRNKIKKIWIERPSLYMDIEFGDESFKQLNLLEGAESFVFLPDKASAKQHFDFKSGDYIFRFRVNDNESTSIATFGDTSHSNLMAFYLDDSSRLTEIILYNISEYQKRTPALKYCAGGPSTESFAMYFVDYDDFGEPIVVSDFKTYIDENSLTFVFNDHPSEFTKTVGRVLMGFDGDSEPAFVKIDQLTEEEYKTILDSF